jgi:predicted small lipoprotein YifL
MHALGRAALAVLVLLSLAGCGDKTIALRYAPPAAASAVATAPAVTVFAFRDARGSEGDNDPYRVGGIYGGYGNRLSKVSATAPLMTTLVQALAAGFQARGVPAQAAADRQFHPGNPGVTGYALGGELKNFSTEARFTNSAHISAIVRLYQADGTVAAQKEISQRVQSQYGGAGMFTPVDDLERIMNDALAKFVERIATDPDLAGRLTGAPR